MRRLASWPEARPGRELTRRRSRMHAGAILSAAFEQHAEKNLIQPTFIIDYPDGAYRPSPSTSPATKRLRWSASKASSAARRSANAYSELNDPMVQLERFQSPAQREKELGDDEAYALDEDFVSESGGRHAPGGRHGNRHRPLVMFLTNAYSIRDVILFPTMKPDLV